MDQVLGGRSDFEASHVFSTGLSGLIRLTKSDYESFVNGGLVAPVTEETSQTPDPEPASGETGEAADGGEDQCGTQEDPLKVDQEYALASGETGTITYTLQGFGYSYNHLPSMGARRQQ